MTTPITLPVIHRLYQCRICGEMHDGPVFDMCEACRHYRPAENPHYLVETRSYGATFDALPEAVAQAEEWRDNGQTYVRVYHVRYGKLTPVLQCPTDGCSNELVDGQETCAPCQRALAEFNAAAFVVHANACAREGNDTVESAEALAAKMNATLLDHDPPRNHPDDCDCGDCGYENHDEHLTAPLGDDDPCPDCDPDNQTLCADCWCDRYTD